MSSKRPLPQQSTPDIAAIEPFRDRLGVWLSYAGTAYYRAYREALKPIRLRPSWVTALAFIRGNPGITQSQLGRLMAINRASAMALASGLETEGFVSRTPAQGRNQTLLALTAEGATVLDKAYAVETALSDQLMGHFDSQTRSGLIKTLQEIHEVLSRERPD